MPSTRWMISGALAAMLVTTAAWSDMNDQQQRAASGGAIGAGGGALFGWAVGGSPLVGALVGGAGGATVGALTSKDQGGSNHSTANKSTSYNLAVPDALRLWQLINAHVLPRATDAQVNAFWAWHIRRVSAVRRIS